MGVEFARLAVQTQLEYPAFLLTWLLFLPIQYFGGIWLLRILTLRFQSFAGWEFPQICFLFGLAGLSQGLVVLLFIRTWDMDRYVIRGEFDQMLLRPLSVLFQLIFQQLNLIGVLDLVPALIIFAYGAALADLAWTPLAVAQLLGVLAGATAIRAGVFLLFGSLAFWTRRIRSTVYLNVVLLERTTQYPLSIYAYWVQLALTLLLPIGFISFYPAAGLLARGDLVALPAAVPVLTPLVGILFFAFAAAVFRRGLSRYTSVGS